MRILPIDYRVGALGAFFVLQAYGLLLFYGFTNGLSIVRSSREIDPFDLFQLLVFIVFFSGYGFLQSKLMTEMESFLKTEVSLDSVLDELRSLPGAIIRGVLGILSLILVFVLWFRPDLLGYAPVQLKVLIAYQVGCPVVTYIGGRLAFGAHRATETRRVYIPRSDLIGGVSSLIVPGIMAWLADVLLIKNQDPMHIFMTAGLGMSTLGITLFMVTSMEGREWELPSAVK